RAGAALAARAARAARSARSAAGRSGARRSLIGPRLEARVAVVAWSWIERRDGVRDELRRVPLLAALILPLAGLEPAFHVHLAALAQVLGGALGKRAPGDHPEPLGLLLPVAVLVLVVAVDRDGELGDS